MSVMQISHKERLNASKPQGVALGYVIIGPYLSASRR